MPMGEDPNQRGGSRKWIVGEVENSLRWLGTDYIDLYQMHRPDHETDLRETLAALTDLVRAGKIRAFGSSMFPAEMITEAQWATERQGSYRFTTEQPMYSIFTRKHEAGLTLPQLATAFVRAHPAVTSVLIGPRTADRLDGLLSGADIELPADVLDRIDEIVPPGTDLDPRDNYAATPPAIADARLRRR